MPEHAAGRADRARPDADEHAGRAGAHQVQARVVGGAAADDHRGRCQLADELLEVQRRPALVARDVLGGDDGALDDEDVEPGLERDLVVRADLLRRQRGGGDDAVGLDLLDPARDQLGLDRLAVDVLHLAGRDVAREGGDPLELLVGVLVAAEDALEVEDGEAAELADDAGARRARRRRRARLRASAARTGRDRASSVMSMSSGSRVRREGTIAMSSNPYARRAFLPRPISTSIAES